MTLIKQTEQSLIKKLTRTSRTNRAGVIVGIGDDAAVIKQQGGDFLLATVDCQVEGVHFKRGQIAVFDLGQKAVVAAISDIAAMGGMPTYLLVSLVISKQIDTDYVGNLYKGIRETCRRYKIALVGGNIARGRQIIIDAFVLGNVKPKEFILRSGAKIGDLVLLTGKLGDTPVARILEGQIIGQSRVATAMIDVSDGLSTDLLRICDASNVGVRIYLDKLPLSSVILASDKGARPESGGDFGQARITALHRGEDYELCFTANQKDAEKIITRVKRETGTQVTIIGEILSKKEGCWLIDEKGGKIKLEAGGWDHLKMKNEK